MTFIKNLNVAQRSLYDIRDGKSYTIRKLADGNCWMTDDLNLDIGTYSAPKTVVASKNDKSTFSWTPTTCGTGGSGTCAFNGNTTYVTTTNRWYYNWGAATAEMGTSSSVGDVDGSICPAGWKLPYNYTISTTKSFGALTNTYGLTTNGANNNSSSAAVAQRFPLTFGITGAVISGGTLNYLNSYGYWHSSTAQTTSMAYNLLLGGYTWPQDTTSGGKTSGYTVRCIAI